MIRSQLMLGGQVPLQWPALKVGREADGEGKRWKYRVLVGRSAKEIR